MIGIIYALQDEFEHILNYVDDKTEIIHYQWNFFQGKIHDKKVVVVKSGVGKVNAALCVSILKREFNISSLISIGTGGILNESKLKIGDIVVGKTQSYHDCYYQNTSADTFADLLTDVAINFDSEPSSTEKIHSILIHHKSVIDETARKYKLKDTPNIITGKIVTGDMPVFEKARANQISQALLADCVDMETAGIAHACKLFGIPFSSIRVMSDFANELSFITFLRNVKRLCPFMAEVLCLIIRHL